MATILRNILALIGGAAVESAIDMSLIAAGGFLVRRRPA